MSDKILYGVSLVFIFYVIWNFIVPKGSKREVKRKNMMLSHFKSIQEKIEQAYDVPDLARRFTMIKGVKKMVETYSYDFRDQPGINYYVKLLNQNIKTRDLLINNDNDQ